MKKEFNTWEGIYETFQDAASNETGPGFNGDIWKTRTLNSARESLEAIRAGLPIPSFYKQRSTLLPVVTAMMLADHEKLDILDLGGGLGIGFMSLAESIPNYADRIEYTIVEVPEICDTGRDLFSKGEIKYLSELPSTGKFHLIHSASAIQYIKDWKGLLTKFIQYEPEYLFLSDVFAGDVPTFATLQNYYDSKIPHWFFNIEELLSFISYLGYEMIMKSFVSSRRLDVDDVLPMDNFPEDYRLNQSVHLLFRRS